jgi:pimeloyl-ACP methyl ester carboxylesterase/ribosomal protein S18 acetylase RimI-like enzyme
MEVRRARAADWEALRDLRLHALADAPDAFASTLEAELAFPEAEWRRRAAGGPASARFIARDGGADVGLAAIFAEPATPRRMHLVSMWVDPRHRRRGLARALVDQALRWAVERQAREVILWVVDGNSSARRLYERVGFRPTGERQPLPSNPELTESMLRLHLERSRHGREPQGGVHMAGPIPILLIPGLLASARLFEQQLPALWRLGPVTIADQTRDDTVAGIAGRILAGAPPRFALAGLSMGGYVAFEILRRAPERVARLALLDSSARPDTPEQTQRRLGQIELARGGRFGEIADQQFPLLVHRSRHGDAAARELVRLMADETGPEAFIRQQQAIMDRPDSRPGLAAIGCPTLVLVGDDDQLTPPAWSEELAAGIPGARLVVVAGAGHLSTLDQPERVTEALVAWASGEELTPPGDVAGAQLPGR